MLNVRTLSSVLLAMALMPLISAMTPNDQQNNNGNGNGDSDSDQRNINQSSGVDATYMPKVPPGDELPPPEGDSRPIHRERSVFTCTKEPLLTAQPPTGPTCACASRGASSSRAPRWGSATARRGRRARSGKSGTPTSAKRAA